jgi:hypothetical protein
VLHAIQNAGTQSRCTNRKADVPSRRWRGCQSCWFLAGCKLNEKRVVLDLTQITLCMPRLDKLTSCPARSQRAAYSDEGCDNDH